MIRNKSIAAAKGEYVIFLDGDCIPQISFINRHQELAEAGYFVAGNRILLSQKFTKQILKNSISVYEWTMWQWFLAFCVEKVNRFLSLIYFKKIYPRYRCCYK